MSLWYSLSDEQKKILEYEDPLIAAKLKAKKNNVNFKALVNNINVLLTNIFKYINVESGVYIVRSENYDSLDKNISIYTHHINNVVDKLIDDVFFYGCNTVKFTNDMTGETHYISKTYKCIHIDEFKKLCNKINVIYEDYIIIPQHNICERYSSEEDNDNNNININDVLPLSYSYDETKEDEITYKSITLNFNEELYSYIFPLEICGYIPKKQPIDCKIFHNRQYIDIVKFNERYKLWEAYNQFKNIEVYESRIQNTKKIPSILDNVQSVYNDDTTTDAVMNTLSEITNNIFKFVSIQTERESAELAYEWVHYAIHIQSNERDLIMKYILQLTEYIKNYEHLCDELCIYGYDIITLYTLKGPIHIAKEYKILKLNTFIKLCIRHNLDYNDYIMTIGQSCLSVATSNRNSTDYLHWKSNSTYILPTTINPYGITSEKIDASVFKKFMFIDAVKYHNDTHK
jgi:hypothetical protein